MYRVHLNGFVCRLAAGEPAVVTSLRDVMSEEKGRADEKPAKKLTLNTARGTWPAHAAAASSATGDNSFRWDIYMSV